ncbi:PLP-dependent aminotransferase family protein [Deinococcus humi]|uniref:GntR family transcriptional regulator/MocR family aminotransferase n=1 Tax=Deinococcus humi TaxID=662880 RepID=A0A7W8NI05_9DEIO|nr:PLP-dependent aminotransferase family protein [Deinococcus humi]MBB5365323.1 GntR family transcriptional regulator/MocR family aminotransferase [Deinococcus humi]GGO36325.1 transcriptional regulator [Deinococcus humi]
MTALAFHIDRVKKMPLSKQIYCAIRDAIESGQIPAHAKLPSWRDLAAQLGVSRGTVRLAYERLIDEQLAVGLGAAGTRVTERPPSSSRSVTTTEAVPMSTLFRDFSTRPVVFQMGVPAQDAFPQPLWSRLAIQAAREASTAPVGYPDPRGDAALRGEVAAYLSIARGLQCSPSQVFITAGFAGALGLVTRGLRLEGQTAWVEDPGFPLTRTGLTLAGLTVAAIPVDAEGLDVDAGLRLAGNATLAVVTPGQQAPLGMTMSLARRLQLLDWARSTGAWIIEDDYLGELQLNGRAAPALASLAHDERVLHVGTFSKTISPALRLGFLVVPPALVRPFGDLAACLAPAPAGAVQRTVANFMHGGHYLRHLRRMKRLYAARRAALLRCLEEEASDALTVQMTAGMAVVTGLTGPGSDVEIARRAWPFGLAPTPLSPWSVRAPQAQGLLLGVTNINEQRLAADCRRLAALART